MRIAIVLMRYNPYGGYERQAAMLAEAFAERGHEVTVFASEWAADASGRIRFRKVPVIRAASWLKVLSFALNSRRLIERERFDATIAFDRTLVMDFYRAGNACHREWLRFRRENNGLLDAVSTAINPLHPVVNRLEKRIFEGIEKNGGRIVVLSPLGMEQIRRHYRVDEKRFVVIPPAVDFLTADDEGRHARREETRKALGAPDDTLLLLHVGSGFRIKGLKNTIEALPALSAGGVKALLVVVGSDRRETGRLAALASRLGMADRVRFLGGVKETGGYYAAADLFVVPSLFETFGVAAMEALYFGLPVIVGRGAGAASLIEKERIGRVIDTPADPAALAAMIAEAAREEKELKRSGRMAEERARRRTAALHCSRENVLARYFSLIEGKAAARQDAVN